MSVWEGTPQGQVVTVEAFLLPFVLTGSCRSCCISFAYKYEVGVLTDPAIPLYTGLPTWRWPFCFDFNIDPLGCDPRQLVAGPDGAVLLY